MKREPWRFLLIVLILLLPARGFAAIGMSFPVGSLSVAAEAHCAEAFQTAGAFHPVAASDRQPVFGDLPSGGLGHHQKSGLSDHCKDLSSACCTGLAMTSAPLFMSQHSLTAAMNGAAFSAFSPALVRLPERPPRLTIILL
ncbi:hypothetical protein [Undibacterium oligocarboniphilum]|uniref:Uncharacterized protein n=1 Tax=Undibacterium oligocarboniphilum TaxID=666702 RepID=A0A850QD86_9BURK|nr:hypothetical protein [Undibacterium oligocarboniphilum]MBC3869685.1 hypothetical protein [Undibacterium oligocarboniphilum]NVO77288.1 hypothetical protein [Undibacterium oligocarboniphilum]